MHGSVWWTASSQLVGVEVTGKYWRLVVLGPPYSVPSPVGYEQESEFSIVALSPDGKTAACEAIWPPNTHGLELVSLTDGRVVQRVALNWEVWDGDWPRWPVTDAIFFPCPLPIGEERIVWHSGVVRLSLRTGRSRRIRGAWGAMAYTSAESIPVAYVGGQP
jgi:hypothetical protein